MLKRLLVTFACVCLVLHQADLVSAKKGKGRWYSVTDETTSKLYYWNKATGETSWTKPKGVRVTPGVKYHHKRSNASPPPSSKKAAKARKTSKAKPKQKEPVPNKATPQAEEESEYEIFDEEGDVIPPPPPVISYVFVIVGIAALVLVGAVLFVNSRRDANMMNDVYKKQ